MRVSALVLGFAIALAASPSARAGGVVDLVWISSSNPAAAPGIGTDTIRAAPGDQVGLRVLLAATGEDNLYAWGISVGFDFDGLDELDVQSVEELWPAPTITCTPFPSCFFNTPIITPFTPGVEGVQESTSMDIGFVYTFEAHTLGVGAVASFGSFPIGEIWFEVTENVGSDGFDVESGFFSVWDSMSSDHGVVDPTFGRATLNRVPDCQDGTDNDGDAEIDGLDPGCDDAEDPSEHSPALPCDDGTDNDRDTLVDFGEDTGCLTLTHPTEVGDEDGDSVADDADNCSLVANPNQVDSDGDSCGNFCDSDYNNDGFAGIPDFNIFRLAFGTRPGEPGYDPSIDHNSDGIIGIPDHNYFRLGVGGPAGPSGTTAGTLACP